MKVLHLIQKPQLRGAEVFASQLAKHLEELGHKAVLVCVFSGVTSLPFDGKIYQLGAHQSLRFIDVKAWKSLATIIKKEQPDVIQANAGDTLKYAVFSKLLFRWKQPIVFRNASIISLYIKSKFIRLFNAFLFSKTSAVISVSNNSAADFVKMFPEFKKNIITIPVGIETDSGIKFSNMSSPALQGNPVLVHVGGFSYEKNHTGLISILEQVIKKHSNAVLHLIGDGMLKQQTETLVKQKQLENHVVFHGFQKQPLLYISKADIMLLPSIIEGLPGVVLEAFYCKTPVIAYDTGGVSEIVINSKTGLLIPKQNEAAFADAITYLLQNSVEKSRLIANAYQLVTTQYLNKDIAARFVKAYCAFIDRREESLEVLIPQENKNVIQNDYV